MIPIWLSFLIGFIVYTLGAVMSNSPTIKQSSYYLYLALGLGLVANFVWFSLVKTISDHSKILLYGLYWDIIIIGTFVAVPILFYGARFKFYTALGIALIILGFFLTKVR
jgi:drug/metabolite transporter (DMT)-like permease